MNELSYEKTVEILKARVEGAGKQIEDVKKLIAIALKAGEDVGTYESQLADLEAKYAMWKAALEGT